MEEIALNTRRDLVQLEMAVKVADLRSALARAAFLPTVGIQVEGGYLEERYRFDSDNRYLAATALFRWELFNGLQHRNHYREMVLAGKKVALQIRQLKEGIRLEVRKGVEELRVVERQMNTARQQLVWAREVLDIVSRKYAMGTALDVEFLDARNRWTGARLSLALSAWDLRMRLAELDHACGRSVNEKEPAS